eukprot:12409067-Karenia_brevis.AAC.1
MTFLGSAAAKYASSSLPWGPSMTSFPICPSMLLTCHLEQAMLGLTMPGDTILPHLGNITTIGIGALMMLAPGEQTGLAMTELLS